LEFEGPGTATECPSEFVYVSRIRKCYKLVLTEMRWFAAFQHCASVYGAHLVFIGSVSEQRAIVGLLRSFPGNIANFDLIIFL